MKQLIFLILCSSFLQAQGALQELELMIKSQKPLPEYQVAGYSPLGRSPVVDALLADPFYMPSYAKKVSQILKKRTKLESLYGVSSACFLAGAIPLSQEEFSLISPKTVPEKFVQYFGKNLGKRLYSYWLTFIKVYRETEEILDALSYDEKKWLLDNYDAFFFGEQDGNKTKKENYDFFTTNSKLPFQFFKLASRVDVAKFSDSARMLSMIVDDLHSHEAELKAFSFKDQFKWEEAGLTFVISGLTGVEHKESADFFLDLGGSNTFYNNAGGTEGVRACSLHLDLRGNNHYKGKNFVQGSGFLGVGVLASLAGNNHYQADSYAQGCGFFGTGILMNLKGNNSFELNFSGQSSALFGSSLLWNLEGNNRYMAHEGMAQSASSTLGVSFLIDNQGHNEYVSGVSGKGDSRYGGIGQAGSTGVRFYPWIGYPSLYGGFSFLYNGGSNNSFTTAWLGQGSAYFLSAAALVIDGSHNTLTADYDAQGQGLHLSAGIFLQNGGQSKFKGGFGSMGSAGDLSAGMCILTQGNNSFEATTQSIGAARKTKAVALFIEAAGKNAYTFQKGSCGSIQMPAGPFDFPKALFLQLEKSKAEKNSYSQNIDNLKRGLNLSWKIDDHAFGIDTVVKIDDIAKSIFAQFPTAPRAPFSFDPEKGSQQNRAYLPLVPIDGENDLQALIQKISALDYDGRRQAYESIDLARFSNSHLVVDLSSILRDIKALPQDLFNYALLCTYLNKNTKPLEAVTKALDEGIIPAESSRKLAIMYVAKYNENCTPLLFKIMLQDSSEENRGTAAYSLATHATEGSLNLLQKSLKSSSVGVRYAIAKGLQDSKLKGVLDLVLPLFQDQSFYVRRAAALTAISLHDKEGIPILLDTLQYDTLDTEENYGDNIYSELSQYVGVNFGIDRNAWLNWWQQNAKTFEFPLNQEKK